jgi:anti-sigma B factor antagonist
MSLSLKIHAEGEEATVACSGKLVAGVTETLSTEVRELLPKCARVVLDFTELEKMDSMGLGTIVRLMVSAKRAGCRLEFINVSARVKELFGITGLMSILESCGEQRTRLP